MDEWIEALTREGWILMFASTLDDHLNTITMVTARRGDVSITKMGCNTVKSVSRIMEACAEHTPALLDEC